MSDISRRVMRRVYFIWVVRQLASPLFLKIVMLVVLLWQVKEAVFVRQVFVNMAHYQMTELFNFWSAAFLNTSSMVQIAVLGVGILSVLLVRDVVAARKNSMVLAKN